MSETRLMMRWRRREQPRWGRVYTRLLFAGLAMLLSACQILGLPPLLGGDRAGTTGPATDALSQWAVAATASSAYGRPDWSPNRASGPPDVNACSDDPRAWASSRGNGVEWLELEYGEPLFATEVRVYQTFGRGAISRITLIDLEGNSRIVWEGRDVDVQCPGVLIARMEPTVTKVARVRIDLDESRTGFWNQIDAVELVGLP
jgi:hypothetical protein